MRIAGDVLTAPPTPLAPSETTKPRGKRADRGSPLRKCIATVALSGTLRDKLEVLRSALTNLESDLPTFMDADNSADLGDPGLISPSAISRQCPIRTPSKFGSCGMQIRCHAGFGHRSVLVCSNTQSAAIDDDSRAGRSGGDGRACGAARRWGFRQALSRGRHVNLWGHAWRIVTASGPLIRRWASSRISRHWATTHPVSLRCRQRNVRVQMADAPSCPWTC